MTEITRQIIDDVLAGKPSAVIDSVAAMIKARAAEVVAGRWGSPQAESEATPAAEASDQPEGENNEEA